MKLSFYPKYLQPSFESSFSPKFRLTRFSRAGRGFHAISRGCAQKRRAGKRATPENRWRENECVFWLDTKLDFQGSRTVANQEANRSINTTGVQNHSVTPIFLSLALVFYFWEKKIFFSVSMFAYLDDTRVTAVNRAREKAKQRYSWL